MINAWADICVKRNETLAGSCLLSLGHTHAQKERHSLAAYPCALMCVLRWGGDERVFEGLG